MKLGYGCIKKESIGTVPFYILALAMWIVWLACGAAFMTFVLIPIVIGPLLLADKVLMWMGLMDEGETTSEGYWQNKTMREEEKKLSGGRDGEEKSCP